MRAAEILILFRNGLRLPRRSAASLALLAVFLLSLAPWRLALGAGALVQDTTQDAAAELLAQLSPKERVGQLFLVTFNGTQVGEDTPLHTLIQNGHIGGAMLLAANDNFTTGPDANQNLQALVRQIHLARWTAVQNSSTITQTSEVEKLNFIPLLVGTSQEGDGYPNDQILNGLTPLPSEMALGAAWNPDLVEQVAAVSGQELSALGFNLLLGPALDVLESPQPDSGSDLGTRAFGGDPFWVSSLGSAYVRGLHLGSAGKIAVIAKHFPGNGGADRPPEEEVATVRKSFEDLKKFDLAPFFAVTGNAAAPEVTVDGLLASHIRYQGFQENIRATTRPVSFDPQAFSLLMNLPVLSAWRQNGGLMVSDNLGSRAVRRFYELTGQTFDARRVALNAFLAGNDVLYLGDMSNQADSDNLTAITRILEFFTQKYQEDPAFAMRVDESVLRILRMKYRMYPRFILQDVLPAAENLASLGQATQLTFEAARQGATLISPSAAEYDTALQDPPNQNDRLVFITDSRTTQQCRQCPEQPVLSPDALPQAVLRLYGPQAAGQVTTSNLSAHSYTGLVEMLDNKPNTTQIERDLRRAHWVVFAMLNASDELPTSLALHRFLAERPDLLQQKRLVVFSFNAPYYLDATDISKITVYFGLYSHTPSFVDVAARLLFRELRPTGSLPVSVPGVGYDLISATSPDAAQLIPLLLDQPNGPVAQITALPQPTPAVLYHVGETIPVRTGVILDHNGHPVPDDTPVQFIVTVNGEQIGLPQSQTTRQGIAHASILVNTGGILEIRVESEPAKQSEVLRFEIPADSAIAPTPTLTTQPTNAPTPTPTATPKPTAAPAAAAPASQRPNLGDWFMALLVTTGIGALAYRLSSLAGYVRWGVRGGFLAVIGGLLAYTYLAVQMPGSVEFVGRAGAWAVLLTTLAGSVSGLALAWGWRYVQARREST